MHEFFFANYRLLTDDGIAKHESTTRLANFAMPMPYTHTFTLRLGDAADLEEKCAWALNCPMAYETEYFTIHDTGDGWAFVNTPADERRLAEGARNAVLCSRNYCDITVYVPDRFFNADRNGQRLRLKLPIPLSGFIRTACGAGAAITYMSGGTYEQIGGTITNTLGNVGGIVCDGAKPSCAAKIASSVHAALLAHYMSTSQKEFHGGEGFVESDVEKTIKNMGYIGKIGMKETDREILNVMIDKVDVESCL